MPHGCGHNLSPNERLVHQTTRRLVGAGWLANAVGATGVFMAVGFLAEVFFTGLNAEELGKENLPYLIAAIALGGLVLTVITKRRRRQALAWLVEGREPTEREHQMTLGMPTFTAVLTVGAWVVGGTVGGILNLDHGFDTAVLVTVTFWFGGDVTAALGYLISERLMRPI